MFVDTVSGRVGKHLYPGQGGKCLAARIDGGRAGGRRGAQPREQQRLKLHIALKKGICYNSDKQIDRKRVHYNERGISNVKRE